MHIATPKRFVDEAEAKEELRFTDIKKYLITNYEQNTFVKLLKMQIDVVDAGRVEVTMPICSDIHTNLYGAAHGGALASLADTAMGLACATFKKRVVTLDLNINYLRGVTAQPVIRAVGIVIHNGSRTIVTECEILDNENMLLAKARGTFFVIGRFEGV